MGRNKKKPFYEKVTIEDVGAEGKAIAHVDKMVVFTKHAVPGDVVDLQVVKKKRKYQEANVVRYHEYSNERVNAFCTHFEICGGCKWQFLPYSRQLYYKQKQVADQLRRIGKVEIPELKPIIGSAEETFYRNKLEFTFSNRRWLTKEEIDSGDQIEESNALGFHVPGLFDKVINVDKCWLQSDPSNQIRTFIYNYAVTNKLDFFDIREKEGFLRTLIIRTSSIGEVMVIVSFFKEDKPARESLLNELIHEFPAITSLMFVVNPKGNDTITDLNIELYKGRDYILEEVEGLQFKIGPKSFYQTNSGQAYTLYKVARDFAGLKGDEVVYDLYTGTGTIANFVAPRCKKVVGIEYVPEAIEDAIQNSKLNHIENTVFKAGDMKDVLDDEFILEHGKPDVIITDPPRAGMHDDVIKMLLRINPGKIVYVSCNPATQARDILLLSDQYKVQKVQPVDMFPHTHHVENVVLLVKKA